MKYHRRIAIKIGEPQIVDNFRVEEKKKWHGDEREFKKGNSTRSVIVDCEQSLHHLFLNAFLTNASSILNKRSIQNQRPIVVGIGNIF